MFLFFAMLFQKEVPCLTLGRVCPFKQASNFCRCKVSLLLLGLQSCFCKTHLEHLKTKHLVFNQTAHHKPVDPDLTLLAYTVNTLDGLCIHCRVPCRVQENNSVSASEV